MKLSLRGRGRRLHDNNFLFAEAAAPAARTASNYGEHDEQDDADNNARDRSRVDFAAIVLGLGIAKIATPLVRLLHDDVTTSRVRITLGVQLARCIQSGTRLGRAQVCRTCIPRVRSRAFVIVRRSFRGFLARGRRWFFGYSRQRRIRRLERNDRQEEYRKDSQLSHQNHNRN